MQGLGLVPDTECRTDRGLLGPPLPKAGGVDSRAPAFGLTPGQTRVSHLGRPWGKPSWGPSGLSPSPAAVISPSPPGVAFTPPGSPHPGPSGTSSPPLGCGGTWCSYSSELRLQSSQARLSPGSSLRREDKQRPRGWASPQSGHRSPHQLSQVSSVKAPGSSTDLRAMRSGWGFKLLSLGGFLPQH